MPESNWIHRRLRREVSFIGVELAGQEFRLSLFTSCTRLPFMSRLPYEGALSDFATNRHESCGSEVGTEGVGWRCLLGTSQGW